jgi:TatD DNase family protein
MMLIDTHTHLYVKQFNSDREAVIERAIANDIQKFYLPNIDRNSIDALLSLENKYPQRCFAMMGLHPCSVKEDYEEELAVVKSWLDKRPFCAVGEIGIDLYWDKTFLEQQKDAFRRQSRWAVELGLPIVIHSRESTDIIIDLIKELNLPGLKGIFHCFGGTETQARQIIELGFLLGIGGVLTYKNSGLQESLRSISLEHIVLETDSPYLAPVPFRGKRNESAYIKYIAEKLAEVKSVTVEEIAAVTSENAENLFVTYDTKVPEVGDL